MSSTLTVVTASADDTMTLAGALAPVLQPGDIVVLAGGLGSGKTTFARGVGRALGVTEPVVSPTFTIVREYEARVPLVHVDVYRLDKVQELHDLGLEELIDERAVTLVEWGDVIAAYFPGDRLDVRLEAGPGDDDRMITLTLHGRSWRAREDAVSTAIDGAGTTAAAS
ncbi:MAG: tRNA (adenosine(37)-N6)-threonylcarbamoyltransferase complex ATPase subunit type 1 TsaE [Acidimicrobiia bacterium]